MVVVELLHALARGGAIGHGAAHLHAFGHLYVQHEGLALCIAQRAVAPYPAGLTEQALGFEQAVAETAGLIAVRHLHHGAENVGRQLGSPGLKRGQFVRWSAEVPAFGPGADHLRARYYRRPDACGDPGAHVGKAARTRRCRAYAACAVGLAGQVSVALA
jgi:hypothetical protein